MVRGIGIVNCVYVNRTTGQFWLIDYRIYSPEQDGKTELDHVEDILKNPQELEHFCLLMKLV